MWSLEDFDKSELIELIRENAVYRNLGFRPVYFALCIRKKRLEKEIRREMDDIACYDRVSEEAEAGGYWLFVEELRHWKRLSMEDIEHLKDELALVVEELSKFD